MPVFFISIFLKEIDEILTIVHSFNRVTQITITFYSVSISISQFKSGLYHNCPWVTSSGQS